MQPLVSILIPCYNAEKYVADAIQSALGQTYKNIEVIVVDDGSTDKSLEVIRSFGNSIQHESIPNSGACVARNKALKISAGEYIQFLDADDILESIKIESHLPYLINDIADILFGGAYFFDENGKISFGQKYPPIQGDPFIYLLNWTYGTACPLHRRKCLELVGGFNEHLERGQEFDLHLRLAAKNLRIINIDDRLSGIRLHNDPRITSRKMPPGYTLNLLLKIADELELYDLLNETRKFALATKISNHSMYSFRNGDRRSACKGFEYVKKLSSQNVYNERLWVKSLVLVFGPYNTECILDFFRRLFLEHK